MCVLCKFTRHTNHQFRFHASVFFLPCRSVRFVFKIIFGNVFIVQTVVHAVLCNQQIEYGRHQLCFTVGQRDFFHRHFAVNHFVVFAAIVAKADAHHIVRTLFQRTRCKDFLTLRFGFQVPFGAAVPTEAHRTVRHGQAVGILIPNNGFPFGIFLFAQLLVQLGRTQTVTRTVALLVFVQAHQHRHIGQAASVVFKIIGRIVDVEFFQNHMTHGHGQCRIRTLARRHPDIAEFRHFAEVGRDGDGFRAFVTHFGIKVCVRRTRHRDVRTPNQQVVGVIPVGRFGNVGLFAPCLWRCGRQITIPVVERQGDTANQAQIARTGGITHHRHGRNRREADNAVRAVLFDGVCVGGGNQLVSLFPSGTYETAQAALGFVGFGAVFVAHNPFPRFNRVFGFACFAPQFGQCASHHRIFDALCGIHIPTERRAARTAAWFVVRQIGACARIVRLLRFPCDNAAFHVNLPTARTSTVHAVCGADDFIVRPAAAVGLLPTAVFGR